MTFEHLTTVLSLLGDAAVLVLTVYTLNITAFSKRLKFISCSTSYSMFFGTTVSITLMNKSLHAIPISEIFILKRHNGEFFRISIAKYKNPIIIDSWGVKVFESEPFTKINTWSDDNLDLNELLKDSVIGIKAGQEIVWVKPYNKAPIHAAKKAYKRFVFQNLTVFRKSIDGKILSINVRYQITVVMYDINGQKQLHTIFGIPIFDNEQNSMLLSEPLNGYNAFPFEKDSEASIEKAICDQFGVIKGNVMVRKIGNDL